MQQTAHWIGRTPAELGAKPNPRLWIGDGWLYCPGCEDYYRHEGYSHAREHFVVCTVCGMAWARQERTAARTA